MIVRHAKKEDSKSIAELLGVLGYPQNEQFVLDKLYLQSDSNSCIFVAENGKDVLGFISICLIPMIHDKGHLCKITALAVYPKHERQGVGKALVATAEEFAQKQGSTRFEVISGNHRDNAHIFYRKLGFAKTAQLRFTKNLRK